jgi:serine/threonine-protein kinase HipA
MRKAKIILNNKHAGILSETTEGYEFAYDPEYLNLQEAQPVSLTMPLTAKSFKSQTMFSFFDGLIPEGWLLEMAEENWKLNERDRMGLLLACCRECIGAVSVIDMGNTYAVT